MCSLFFAGGRIMKRFLAIIVFAALAVAMPYVIYTLYQNDKELTEKGISVEATIVSVEGTGRSKDVKVEYKNDKGIMFMLDTISRKIIVYSSEKISSDIEKALKDANTLSAKGDNYGAVSKILEALKKADD